MDRGQIESQILKLLKGSPSLKKAQNRFNKLSTAGLEYGKGLADQFYSPGSLGRLDEGRSKDLAMALSRMRSGLEGYTSPEYSAMREAMSQGINQNLQTGLAEQRRAQGISRTRGASSAAQAANLNRAAIQDKANVERDLFVQGAREKDTRLQNYLNSLSGVERDEYGRKAYNLGQQGAEVAGRAGTTLGGLGAYYGGVLGQQGVKAQNKANKLGGYMSLYQNLLQEDALNKQMSLYGG